MCEFHLNKTNAISIYRNKTIKVVKKVYKNSYQKFHQCPNRKSPFLLERAIGGAVGGERRGGGIIKPILGSQRVSCQYPAVIVSPDTWTHHRAA